MTIYSCMLKRHHYIDLFFIQDGRGSTPQDVWLRILIVYILNLIIMYCFPELKSETNTVAAVNMMMMTTSTTSMKETWSSTKSWSDSTGNILQKSSRTWREGQLCDSECAVYGNITWSVQTLTPWQLKDFLTQSHDW